ncbi:MAG: orotidine-5'-phosphate decarboxylase [Clostridiales bacterium]|nr:orotidine-5'-phosphate decarboxylase [Clostridiales bacterium]
MLMMDKLAFRAKRVSPVCVGLDIQTDFLPKVIAQKDKSIGEKLFEFNKRIIDATANHAACFKIQIACYEALGLDGMTAFFNTLKYLKKIDAIAISDIKRGDISSTAQMYAKGHFTGDFETDIITVNAYMGEDAVSPYYPYLEQGKGMFILVKTSNKKSGDLQDRILDNGETVYMQMARLVDKWGQAFIGESGFSSIGAVVGLTYVDEFIKIKKLMKNTFFLIPGYGAQGGTAQDIGKLFSDGICGVVNSSRGIICAHMGKTDGDDFDIYINEAVVSMQESIKKCL